MHAEGSQFGAQSPDTAHAPPRFRALHHPSLIAAGLSAGIVDVALEPRGLRLTSAQGERLELPFDAIDRLRLGFETGRLGGRLYQMRVWARLARDPLVLLVAGRDTSPGYEGVARAAAAAVADRRGIGCVEGGVGWGGALIPLVLLLPFLAVGSWLSILGFAEGAPLLFLIGLPAAVLLVGGAFGYGFWRLWRPRRLKRPADIDPYVSKGKRPWLF